MTRGQQRDLTLGQKRDLFLELIHKIGRFFALSLTAGFYGQTILSI